MTSRTAIRLAWLTFALLVVVLVFLLNIMQAHAQTMAMCSDGWCVISEQALTLLMQLAGKAGKGCA